MYVDNDANVMALAEYRNMERVVDNMLYVRASDGIGAGLVFGGKLYRGTVGAAEVVELTRRGNQDATTMIRAAGRDLGRVLAGVVNLLDPGAVVMGGELSEVQDFLAGIREEVYRRALPLAAGHLMIVKASLGQDAAIKGPRPWSPKSWSLPGRSWTT